MDAIAPFSTTITIIVIIVGLLIFRKELSAIVTWLSSFRHLEKTKDGYALHGAELPLPAPVILPQEQKVIDSTAEQSNELRQSDDASKDKKHSWIDPYLAGDYAKAAMAFESEISTSSAKEDVDDRSFHAYLVYLSDAVEGKRRFEKLAKEYPHHLGPYKWWALIHQTLHEFDAALDILETGIVNTVDEDRAYLVVEKIEVLKKAGHSERALSVGRAALDQFQFFSKLYLSVANLYLAQKNLPESLGVLERGLKFDPRNESLRDQLATLFFDNGAPEHAALQYSLLINQCPKNEKYHTLLANCWLSLNLNDRAMVSYRKANELAEEKQGWIVANIANHLNNRGLYSDAIDLLQKATKLEPGSEYAHKRLASAIENRDAEIEKANEMLEKAAQGIPPLPSSFKVG